MRFTGLILVVMLPLIVACKLLPEAVDQPPPAAIGQEYSGQAAANAGTGKTPNPEQRPKPRPASVANDAAPLADAAAATAAPIDVTPVEPVIQKSQEQITCENRGGNWGNAGKSTLKTCVKRTRDSGKQCRKQGDCESVCLARSGTCAPVKPLFGCNEILQKDGSRVTLCID